MIKLIVAVLTSVLITSVLLKLGISQETQVSQSKDLVEFENRLSKYINSTKAVTETSALDSKEVTDGIKSANDLWSFASEFPDSKFASDSKRVVIFINFLGGLNSNDKKSMNKWLKNMEGLANFYPDAKMEDFTKQKLKELWGQQTPPECFMTNADLLIYMRASSSVGSNDYESAIQNLSLFKDRLETIKEPSGLLELMVYGYLVSSYEKLGKSEDALNIAKVSITRFPNNTRLKQAMENIINRISSQLESKTQ